MHEIVVQYCHPSHANFAITMVMVVLRVGLLFRENPKKDERLWEHIADPSAKYDFKVIMHACIACPARHAGSAYLSGLPLGCEN